MGPIPPGPLFRRGIPPSGNAVPRGCGQSKLSQSNQSPLHLTRTHRFRQMRTNFAQCQRMIRLIQQIEDGLLHLAQISCLDPEFADTSDLPSCGETNGRAIVPETNRHAPSAILDFGVRQTGGCSRLCHLQGSSAPPLDDATAEEAVGDQRVPGYGLMRCE